MFTASPRSIPHHRLPDNLDRHFPLVGGKGARFRGIIEEPNRSTSFNKFLYSQAEELPSPIGEGSGVRQKRKHWVKFSTIAKSLLFL